MKQPLTEPEYLVAQVSDEMSDTGKLLKCSDLNLVQIEVELEQSLVALRLAIDLLGKITSSLQVLVQSLPEQR